ncbi:baseplate J/gp47 family protein [Peptostreptococcus equinus]|uniref:Baseplate J/gp47 family protein n=1 Tax=Peptostreptococcus equinus TaxID=3003601 RepID=A0ABY7JQ31_9FIRM|nr:baseplate J/gp47 family protein [Peptostreptococcus sp. CBA3647]WAW15462.1 baseplate J/gp47 family protein [Peptostreptococcus sp. CBA3647]
MNDRNFEFGYVMNRILGNIPDEYDKRETSLIYQSAAMIIPELTVIRHEIRMLEDEAFPDTCSYFTLQRFAKNRNMELREPTKGVVIAEFNKEVEIGTRFNHEQRNYAVSELIDLSLFKYRLIAEEVGHIESIGELTPIQDIYGLEKAVITKIEVDGRDEESEEDLRNRFFENISNPAFGGNRADYKEKILGMDNIGAVRLFRRKVSSDGSTKIEAVILDTSYKDASPELVKIVQNALTPTQDGEGLGIAPIDHFVTVLAPTKQSLTIKTNLTLDPLVSDVTQDITSAIEEYLQDLRQQFGEFDLSTGKYSTVVRISRIENRLLDVSGVIDVFGTKINGLNSNVVIDDKSIPVLGGVSYVRV